MNKNLLYNRFHQTMLVLIFLLLNESVEISAVTEAQSLLRTIPRTFFTTEGIQSEPVDTVQSRNDDHSISTDIPTNKSK